MKMYLLKLRLDFIRKVVLKIQADYITMGGKSKALANNK